MALELLEPRFRDIILRDQDCFAEEAGWETLLQLIPDSKVASRLRERWEGKSLSSAKKWADVEREEKKDDVRLPPCSRTGPPHALPSITRS